jgi:hypothetical protein
VDTRLDENEAELGVLVVTVALEVLADGDGLLDEVVEILGNLGREACRRRNRKLGISSAVLTATVEPALLLQRVRFAPAIRPFQRDSPLRLEIFGAVSLPKLLPAAPPPTHKERKAHRWSSRYGGSCYQ